MFCQIAKVVGIGKKGAAQLSERNIDDIWYDIYWALNISALSGPLWSQELRFSEVDQRMFLSAPQKCMTFGFGKDTKSIQKSNWGNDRHQDFLKMLDQAELWTWPHRDSVIDESDGGVPYLIYLPQKYFVLFWCIMKKQYLFMLIGFSCICKHTPSK